MDKSNEDHIQNADNESDNVVTDCLSNSNVVRTILENFSSPELRQLSFVNKLWKSEAQSLMRNRGHFTAYFKSHDMDSLEPRQDIEAFISDLQKMNPIPFSGISMSLCVDYAFGPFPIAESDSVQGVVLDQPSLLKSFSLELVGPWMKNMASPGIRLAKKILQDCNEVLEELSLNIGYGSYGRAAFLERVVKNYTFPRLKTLKLREEYNGFEDVIYVNYMKTLLSQAPNLLMFHTDWPGNLMLSVLEAEGSSVMPVSSSYVAAPFTEISENVINAVRLERMKFVYTGRKFDFERFNRIAPMLLQASCTTTLWSIWLDALLALPLMSYGICLTQVKHLTLGMNYHELESRVPQVLGIVKSFDFARIFPLLSKVEIYAPLSTKISLNHIQAIIQQAEAVLSEPMPDRAVNIKALKLYQWSLSGPAAQFFADMFPNIEKLDIEICPDEIVSFETIWKNWLDLKELTVTGNLLPAAGNLDSAFCGISPEEVAELRLKDDDYLKRVHIVPVMPALNCMKNLKILSLNFKDHDSPSPFNDDATFLFSKVTALLAFAKRSDLAVRLNISARTLPPAMTHLEPYVSITSALYEDQVWSDSDSCSDFD